MEIYLRDELGKFRYIQNTAAENGGLAERLRELAKQRYIGDCMALEKELEVLYGKSMEKLETPEEFWHPELEKAVLQLTDRQFLDDMKEMVKIRMETPFSDRMFRRSYHSSHFGYHASRVLSELVGCLRMELEGENAEGVLEGNYDWHVCYAVRIAVEIKKGNQEIIDKIKKAVSEPNQAISGNNQAYLLSRCVIQAIIISGNEELLEWLVKLLLAAKLQEGVRQRILESADDGSVNTLIRFLKICIDEKLFRFSSAVRAFGVWAGLGYDNMRPELVNKASVIAYECLVDEKKREEYEKSESNLEAYLALWAGGCYEIDDMHKKVRSFLDDEKKYRRILGWSFVSSTENQIYQMKLAASYLKERDGEVLAWVIDNLACTREILWGMYYDKKFSALPKRNPVFSDDEGERRKLFYELKEVAEYIGDQKQTFKGNPFEFHSIELGNEPVMSCMLSVAGYDMKMDLIDELARLISYMSTGQKIAFYQNFLQPDKYAGHREYLMNALTDKSTQVKEFAVSMLEVCDLSLEELEILSKGLRSKSSKIRKAILTVFQKQKKEKLLPVIKSMICSKEEYQVQAAIELLSVFQDISPELVDTCTPELSELSHRKLSKQTQILWDQLNAKRNCEKVLFTEENGFGLYDPKLAGEIRQFPAEEKNVDEAQKERDGYSGKLLKKNDTNLWDANDLEQIFPSQSEFIHILEKMNDVFQKHADYEYEIEGRDGSRTTILFGNSYDYIRLPVKYSKDSKYERELYMIPFYKEFLEVIGEYARKPLKILGLYLVSSRYGEDLYKEKPEAEEWFAPIEATGIGKSFYSIGREKYGNRYEQMRTIIELLYQNFDEHEVFEAAFFICQSIIRIIGEENLARKMYKESENYFYRHTFDKEYNHGMNYKPLGLLRYLLRCTSKAKEDFAKRFELEFRMEEILTPRGYFTYHLSMEDYFRAYSMGILTKDGLYKYLMLDTHKIDALRMLTNPIRYKEGKKLLDKYEWAAEMVNKAVKRIVEVEAKRGEMPTPLTPAALSIYRIEGAEYFCSLLAALGKANFFRGYEFEGGTTKQTVLSKLIKRCYPAKNDTPEELEQLLKQNEISEKRLMEAVMYAPQWSGLVEKMHGWTGLKSAVWFFHAHINETFSAEKETEVALYSPISPEHFNDGNFDRNWFFQAYEQLGEQRFQMLYKSAKYITSGNNQHRRSQLYTDAALGKMDIQELQAEIEEKRNQDKLRCYALIPLDSTEPENLLRRYEFIQKFMRESRQFGAQRRENEMLACIIAMENLALTAGFTDVNRMIWYLESEEFEEIRPLMEPKQIGTVTVKMEIDDEGLAGLVVEKQGKRQKSLPKSLDKNEWILTLKDTIKQLKIQKRRAGESLERAMIENTEFYVDELKKIGGNPVLAPIISKLVWTDGSEVGFIKKENGQMYLYGAGEDYRILKEQKMRVAHPHDLKLAGKWSDFMHYLYVHQIKQPFKQIFREYYPLTEEERKERTVSRRYEGYQVQPKKAAALLKGRGWTVDYEEGLQKVFYKDNLIVRMFAMADWFSPADIEAPTLEGVQFFDRNTGEIADLSDVSPIIFSEIMRDIDLAVSVAHVGGVDPETSHSTVEMRVAIAKELLFLLKLSNVEFIGNHAKIRGNLSNYSVHMGSGVVHSEGSGMIAVLPVHSQARGRIFLPFADDDPKTAEIMSKIILFADDRKIKDANILRQI